MAQKTRVDISNAIASNIFDNNNKEILASNVRSVLGDVRDSYFNIKDDELKNYKYNNTQTLEQYLAAVVGSLPIYGVVTGVNVGENLKTYSGTGIISGATGIDRDGDDFLLEINFTQSIANRRLIPVLTTTSSDYKSSNNVLYPVIRRISSTRINLSLRQYGNRPQNLNIEIIGI